jgi:hypothetical protein
MVLDTASRVSEEAKAEALEPEQPAPEVVEAAETEPAKRAELVTPERLAALAKVVPLVWILAVFVTGWVMSVQVAFLLLAAGVLVLVITLMWSSVQSLTGGTLIGFEEALGMGAPSKVEEEKRAVLRALKDLEYERGVGKISPEDYAELLAKYRAEAKRLIQSVDEALGPSRQQVEQAIEQRLARAGVRLDEAANSEAALAPLAKTAAKDAETEPAPPVDTSQPAEDES